MKKSGVGVLAAGLALLLSAGCGGSGGASSAAGQSPAPATSSSAASPSASPTGCVKAADYCDEFANRNSGWPTDNGSSYYVGYDSYLGGTYRVGERSNKTAPVYAPLDITKVTSDYSVRIDADALVGDGPSDGQFGVLCWEHDTSAGDDSAFLFFVGGGKAEIVLWDDVDGTPHTLASKPLADGVLKPNRQVNHLTASCLQGSNGAAGGYVQAQLSLQINGKPAVSLNYDKNTKSYDWAVGTKVGVLASGQGEDVFFDNFAVTSACVPNPDFPCPGESTKS